MPSSQLSIAFSIIFLLKATNVHAASSWPHWRGPDFNGANVDGLKYPAKFSKQDRVRWKFRVPGASAATPIVSFDRVFLSSIIDPSEMKEFPSRLAAICLDKESGRLLWMKPAGSGYLPENDGNEYQLDSKSNYASPSPVLSQDRVVFFYGNGDIVCFDFEGTEQWRRNLQKDYGDFCFQWTFSASPTIVGDFVYLPVLQRNEKVHGRGKEGAQSFLICLNLSDGSTNWKVLRDTPARMESRESFATIIPFQNKLLVAGGDFLSSHDPLTGKEIWRWGTWNPEHKQEWWRLVPSPVAGHGKIIVCAPKGAPVFAIETPRPNDPQLSWSSVAYKQLTSDVPTPLFYDDHFYILSDLRKTISKVSPLDGTPVWQVQLPGKYKWRSSPTAADGKIFLMNHNANVYVLSAIDGSIIHSALMGDEYDDSTRSSIALSSGRIYVRTNKILYCIE